MKKVISFLVAGAMSLTSVAPAFADDAMMMNKTGVMVGGAMMVPNLNIVQNAMKANNVTTVVAAVKAAGLVDTLSGPGPFTVFAPTDSAFRRIPKKTLAMLLLPENKDKLAAILTYHVVAGALKWNDLKNGQILTTVNGATLKVKKIGNAVWINNARIQITNVVSSNGVTHVINRVLMPPADAMMKKDTMMQSSAMMNGVMVGGALMTPDLNIVTNAMHASNVTTVVAAVQAAGLVSTLSGKGPFTVFAPTNAAFDKLPAGTVATLLKPENKDTLAKILTYHVVAGAYKATDLKDGMSLTTVEGEKLMIMKKDGKIWINNSAMVETADVVSSNGVTHVIDTVLMPAAK